MSDGLWTVCPVCGAVVADPDLHDNYHAAVPQDDASAGEE